MGLFVQWMYQHVVHIDVLLHDVSTFRIFHSGTYHHVMFQAEGHYVAASFTWICVSVTYVAIN
jgi:hypothetical protein